MSITLKKNSFKNQIRRENITKILKGKKEQCQAQRDVNSQLEKYFEGDLNGHVPKICALKFQFIDTKNLQLLINLIKMKKIKLDFSKPENIALVNKLAMTEQTLVFDYFEEITNLAGNLLFALKRNTNLMNSQTKNSLKEKKGIANDIIYFPNCLFQFWAKYYEISSRLNQTSPFICIKSYCVILRSFIYWFEQKSSKYKNLNKNSLCYFLLHFVKYENITIDQEHMHVIYKQVEQLYIKFRITCIPVIIKLLEEKYFCSELIQALLQINKNDLDGDLLRVLCEKTQNNNFFHLLVEGLDNENFFINITKDSKSKLFQSQNLNEEQLKTLQQLSIQKTLLQNVHSKIWKCKENILFAFNSFLTRLTRDGYVNILFHSKVDDIWSKLVKVYIYSTELNNTTSQIQKSICGIFYNILLLIEQDQDFQPQSCLMIKTEQQQDLSQTMKTYLTQNAHQLSLMIQNTRYDAYDHVLDLIEFLKEVSYFVNTKQIDEQIFIEGNLISKICDALLQKQYNIQQSKKIIFGLFEFVEDLICNQFDFKRISSQIIELTNPKFDEYITEEHERLLDEIIQSFQ